MIFGYDEIQMKIMIKILILLNNIIRVGTILLWHININPLYLHNTYLKDTYIITVIANNVSSDLFLLTGH